MENDRYGGQSGTCPPKKVDVREKSKRFGSYLHEKKSNLRRGYVRLGVSRKKGNYEQRI